jgi:Ca-activated chloride channel family protein
MTHIGCMMIFNSVMYENSMPDGIGVLEIADPSSENRRLFVPLTRTILTGTITGPLASFQLTQVFSYKSLSFNYPIEAVYRFPLPGDALITGAEVSFGEEKLITSLKERDDATDEYHSAFEQGRKAILLTYETPDIFTLHLTGIDPDAPVVVTIRFLQYAMIEYIDYSFRIPLTITPRYIREDERFLGKKNADPLLMLIDPGHTFQMDILVIGNPGISSPSHILVIKEEGQSTRVTLSDNEIRPDREVVLICHQQMEDTSPILTSQIEHYPAEDASYILATITPPIHNESGSIHRELIILVDHSGSMEGSKWKAADWTVKKLLKTLQPDEYFALGVFHNDTTWLSKKMSQGTQTKIESAIRFLEKNKNSGGTELGQALEEALAFPKSIGQYARHIIIITDAEVTDEGRLIRMAREEMQEKVSRRISVICIDAEPNTPIVRELVRVGNGTARFLTSDPTEQDITSALDSTLASWIHPAMSGLSLSINRDQIERVEYEPVSKNVPIPDLFGSPMTYVYRVAYSDESMNMHLIDQDGRELTHAQGGKREKVGIRELFGAARIRMLEQIRGGFYEDDEIIKILTTLGYSEKKGKPSLYPEKKWPDGGFFDTVLIQESLRYGLPSSLTAFICTSEHQGTPVKATVIVPSAYPYGWDYVGDDIECVSAPMMCYDMASESSCNEISHIRLSTPVAHDLAGQAKHSRDFTVSLDIMKNNTVFEDTLAGWDTISQIQIRKTTITSVTSDIRIELYINAEMMPRASIPLCDLLSGEERPLNICLKQSDLLVIKLKDIHNLLQTGTIIFRIMDEKEIYYFK